METPSDLGLVVRDESDCEDGKDQVNDSLTYPLTTLHWFTWAGWG